MLALHDCEDTGLTVGLKSGSRARGINGMLAREIGESSLGAVYPIKPNINFALKGLMNGTSVSGLHQLSELLGGEGTR